LRIDENGCECRLTWSLPHRLVEHVAGVRETALQDVRVRLRELGELGEDGADRRVRDLADLRNLRGELLDLARAEVAHDLGGGVGAERQQEDRGLADAADLGRRRRCGHPQAPGLRRYIQARMI
jgi:hypothetical protein